MLSGKHGKLELGVGATTKWLLRARQGQYECEWLRVATEEGVFVTPHPLSKEQDKTKVKNQPVNEQAKG